MTDEEFQRIKEAEKERLRAQKRLRATLKSLKRRNEVQSVVRRMSQGAKRLLRKTEALADKVSSQAARQAARLEVVVEGTEEDLSLEEDEEILREERAEARVRRLKKEDAPTPTRRFESSSDAEEDVSPDPDDDPDSGRDGPDKTIGRMGNHRADDSS